jgi:hypothetical protein
MTNKPTPANSAALRCEKAWDALGLASVFAVVWVSPVDVTLGPFV